MQEPLWVFGYGSLIWDPGFPVAERRIARLDGWHRSFCMRSIHHRGTAENPGLVLALDRAEGATCTGVAFRVAPGQEAATLFALRERELVSSAYLEMTLPSSRTERPPGGAGLCDRPRSRAVLPSRPGRTGTDHRQACGGRGRNCDYLWSTAAHLAELGIRDPDLDWLAERVRALA
jgi:glutathione-specific gamma-glutamylcyclotransferase